MENRDYRNNRNDELNKADLLEHASDNSVYKPNFETEFTDPVRRERRKEEVPYNPTYYYSNNVGSNNSGYNNGSYNNGNYNNGNYNNGNYNNSGYNNQYYSNSGNYNAGDNNQYYRGNEDNPYPSNGNGNESEQIPHKKIKKKRIGLKIVVGVLVAVFMGFGSYGVYEHFFADTNKSLAVAEKDTNKANDIVIGQTTVTDTVGDNKVVTVSENTQPAIVAINSTVTTNNGWGQPYEAKGSGSGIIIKQTDTTLLIATNNHVVEGASNIDVVFIDGKSVAAKIKGTDSTSDLAVVEVKLSDVSDATLKSIKVATLGDSKNVKVGEMVVAIGNALGYGQSVTVGYISAKEREVIIDQNKMMLLQTDAAINPGNSGGALLNLSGEVIGINSAKFTSEDVEGMGYAIPISKAIPIINELVDREVLKEEEKGYIGITGSTVTDEMHSSLNYPYGVFVAEVVKGGPAEKAGIKSYDIITKLNGNEIATMEGFKERLNSYRAGTEVKISVQRIENGVYVEKTFNVTLQDQKVLNVQPNEDSGNTGDNNQGGNTNPYGNGGSNPYGNDGSNPYGSDDWPWSLFQ